MDEYKQYYYSARPSAQGKAYGRSVALGLPPGFWGAPPLPAALTPPTFCCSQRRRPCGSAQEAELQTLPLVHGERLP